jgi:F1F0 ATPase subunit 2
LPVERLIILAEMLFIGFAVGILYFQGLWLTVNRLVGDGKSFGGKMLISFIIRFSVLMVVFYYFMHNDWQRVIALATGFWIARFIMIRRLGASKPGTSY